MEKQAADLYFDQVYDNTYQELCAYVIANIKIVDDAHDVLQNTYLSFYKRLLNKGMIPADEAIKYLKASAKHEMGRYFIRERDRRQTMSLDDDGSYETIMTELRPSQLEKSVIDAEMAQQILNYIRHKDSLTYRVFVLFYSVGLTMRETAGALGISSSNAANRLYRTLGELRRIFGKEDAVGIKNIKKGDDLHVKGKRLEKSGRRTEY
ncbi:MAG: RNA polymerase sigma factor [Clostridiales bacterium]|nr:RNA polymerase sigma factor [Clostridiales bacterium]